MPKETFLWECECGHVEYGETPPQVCKECLSIETFDKVPKELIGKKDKQKVFADVKGDLEYES